MPRIRRRANYDELMSIPQLMRADIPARLPRAYDTCTGIDTVRVTAVITAAAVFHAITDPAVAWLPAVVRPV